MDNRPGLFGVFLGVLRLRFVDHREILLGWCFRAALATFRDHPTHTTRRRASESESTQAIASRDGTIGLVCDSHRPSTISSKPPGGGGAPKSLNRWSGPDRPFPFAIHPDGSRVECAELSSS